MDVITRHRLRQLPVDPDGLGATADRAQLCRAYDAFLATTPYENLSDNLAVVAAPRRPQDWPRTTDRLLREHETYGLGGTSFALAYALRDILHGLGASAHCTLGHNLVTEEAHACVLVFDEQGPWLYDPALLLPGPVPVRPGGALHEPLGCARLQTRCGPTLSLCLEAPGEKPRTVYALLPMPAPPPCFRQAWIASFHGGRLAPLRLARRVGVEIRRYGERACMLEILRPDGRTLVPTGPRPVALLHKQFGIDAALLEEWFDRPHVPA